MFPGSQAEAAMVAVPSPMLLPGDWQPLATCLVGDHHQVLRLASFRGWPGHPFSLLVGRAPLEDRQPCGGGRLVVELPGSRRRVASMVNRGEGIQTMHGPVLDAATDPVRVWWESAHGRSSAQPNHSPPYYLSLWVRCG